MDPREVAHRNSGDKTAVFQLKTVKCGLLPVGPLCKLCENIRGDFYHLILPLVLAVQVHTVRNPIAYRITVPAKTMDLNHHVTLHHHMHIHMKSMQLPACSRPNPDKACKVLLRT
jgi:hypothetical protein